MSKAILVIDMPERCDDCNMCYYSDGKVQLCYWKDKVIDQDKPNWCPLNPLPEKINIPPYDNNIKAKTDNAFEVGAYMYDRGHDRGYNICIDEILRNAD